MFFLAKGATISWRSKKQTIVASSAMEVEFIGCYKATSQAKWLKNFVFGLKVVNFVERRLKIFFRVNLPMSQKLTNMRTIFLFSQSCSLGSSTEPLPSDQTMQELSKEMLVVAGYGICYLGE